MNWAVMHIVVQQLLGIPGTIHNIKYSTGNRRRVRFPSSTSGFAIKWDLLQDNVSISVLLGIIQVIFILTILVHATKVIVTRNVTRVHVPSVRPVTVQSSPPGERYVWLQDQEASSVDKRVKEYEIESVVSSSSGDSSGGKQALP